jgi:hypothetical protein
MVCGRDAGFKWPVNSTMLCYNCYKRSGHSPQREWRSLEEYFLLLSRDKGFETDRSVFSIVSFTTISNEVRTMSNQEWSRAMRAIWLLNTIEVELSHLGIPLMRVPPSLRDLDDIFAEGTMSEQDCQLIENELTFAHASLAQAVGELQAGMTEIENLLRKQPLTLNPEDVAESTRSVVWQKS